MASPTANLDLIRGRQVVVPLMNRTGADSVEGDVVVLDPANDGSYITSITGRETRTVGIVQEPIVSLGTGRVLISGYAPLVNVAAAVTRGDYVETHTVAKQAASSALRRTGSFGQWATSGVTPAAVLWGIPDGTTTGGGSTVFSGAAGFALFSGGDESEPGPMGPPGPAGATGATGPTGPTGPAGSGGGGGGTGGGALVFLQEVACAGLTNADFTSFISSLYDEYVFEFIGLMPSTNLVDFFIGFSNGGVFDTASHYVTNALLVATSGNTGYAITSTCFKARNNGEFVNTGTVPADGKMTLFRPQDTTYGKRMYGNILWNGGSNWVNSILDCHYTETTAVDGVRFKYTTGTFAAGKIRVYGIAKTVSGGASATGFIGAKATNTAGTTTSNGVELAMPLAAEEFDTDGFHDNATNNSRFTVPAGLGGKYLCVGQMTINWTNGSAVYASIKKNGIDYLTYTGRQGGTTAGPPGVTTAAIVDLVPGDYVELYVMQGSGTTQTLLTTAGFNWFSIAKLDSGKVGAGIGAKAKNASFSVPNAAFTAIDLTSEDWDTNAFHDNSTNPSRVTIPAGLGGKYICVLNVVPPGSAAGLVRYYMIYVNGTEVASDRDEIAGGGGYTKSRTATFIGDLVPGDYVQAFVYQDSGGALNYNVTLAVMRLDSGSSGSAATYLGYNTIGGSQQVMTSGRVYCKQITAGPNGNTLLGIQAYIDQTTENAWQAGFFLHADSGSDTIGDLLLAVTTPNAVLGHGTGGGITYPPRWFGASVGYQLSPSTKYWIGIVFHAGSATTRLYYDGSGSDRYYTAGVGPYYNDGAYNTGAQTNTANRHSIRALIL